MTISSGNLTEKDIINDVLATEKQLLNVYSTYLAEASCPNLRNELTRIFTETQQIQFEVFKAMEQKGWYEAQNADLYEIQQAVDKFSQVRNELQ